MTRSQVFAAIIAPLVAASLTTGAQQRDAAPLPVGTAVIAGVLMGVEPPQPIRRAQILWRMEGGRAAGAVTTDNGGRFSIRGLAPGRYTLRAIKMAFLDAAYGARTPAGTGSALAIADGERAEVTIRMARGAAIAGTILDASGRPMPGVTVRALRFSYGAIDGEPALSPGGRSATTDDRGTYRLWGLAPGRYLVQAEVQTLGGRGGIAAGEVRQLTSGDVQRMLAFVAARGSGQPGDTTTMPAPAATSVAYGPAFHPGASDPSQSRPVQLALSDERSGIDVIVRRVATVSVTGTFRADPTNPGPYTVALTPAGPQAVLLGTAMQRPSNVRLQSDGGFVFTGLMPGTYAITVRSPTAVTGYAEIDVQGGRDQTVSIDPMPEIAVTGRVVFEGTAPPPVPPVPPAARVFLVPRGAGGNLSAGGPPATFQADGTTAFSGVAPGHYRVMFTGSPAAGGASSYVRKSVVAKGRDVSDFGLDIGPGDRIEILVTYADVATLATIAGTLQTAAGAAAPDYTIIVFPVDKTFWVPGAARVRAIRPATDGRYDAGVCPPGDYFIAALTDVEPGEWNNRAFLEQLVPGAIKVSLADGQKLNQDIRLK